ncbi:energy transducer TonB [Ferruginibacter sp. SUN106]|uniref:energy transducer TonB n=1 Tax=Ferruginibacter sp. SUN106 TaxID=2978348 RepID=UPI003D35A221
MHPLKTFTLFVSLFSATISFAQDTPPPPADNGDSDDKIFSRVEQEAAFPGGLDGWKKYLMKNLKADVPEKNGAPAGYYTTVVKFIVSKDGTLTDIKAETKLGYGIEDEVIRVIEKSGKWIPAQQNGRVVNAYRRQPITFAVIDETFDITTKVPHLLFAATDNIITVTAEKVKPEDLQLTISKGTIKQIAEGKFIVRVNDPGRVVIELFNTKKNKKIGAASIEVVKQ